jgi:hypothetical protein
MCNAVRSSNAILNLAPIRELHIRSTCERKASRIVKSTLLSNDSYGAHLSILTLSAMILPVVF